MHLSRRSGRPSLISCSRSGPVISMSTPPESPNPRSKILFCEMNEMVPGMSLVASWYSGINSFTRDASVRTDAGEGESR